MTPTIYTHLGAAAIAALIASAATWQAQDWRLGGRINDLRAQHAQQETERTRVALDDARQTFRKSEIHARNQQEIADEHAAQEKRRQARLAAAVADGDLLRQQAAAFAAACGGGEGDSPAAAIKHCRNRAATIGVLLEQADRQAEEFAGAAEQHADEVRTLMRVVANDRSLLPPAGLGLKPGTSTLIESPADAQAQ